MSSGGKSLLVLVVCLALATAASGHGFLAVPKSRNYLHNSNYCPHCLNSGGTKYTRGDIFPESKHTMCGDHPSGEMEHEAGGKFATGEITGTFEEGSFIQLAVGITTYHRGAVEYRICRYAPGTPDQERAALTDSCLEEHVLTQAYIPEAQLAGSRWFFLGNASEDGYDQPKMFYHIFQLPSGLVCDGKSWKCVLQMHWMTANTCNPPQIPRAFRVSYLPTCGTIWPEEFWNCADVAILPKGSYGVDKPDPSLPAFSAALSRGPSEFEFIDDTASLLPGAVYYPFPSLNAHNHIAYSPAEGSDVSHILTSQSQN